MNCIITGCSLIGPDGRWVSGDLFEVTENVLVFNGNVTFTRSGCEPTWNEGQPFYQKTVTPSNWWERRGVFVFTAAEAYLNEAAVRYARG